MGEAVRRLARQRESENEEGHLRPGHVHVMISIPPEYAVAQVVGYIRGKSAIRIAQEVGKRRRDFSGHHVRSPTTRAGLPTAIA